MEARLTPWAEEMRRVFISDTVNQFVIFGNISDLVPAPPSRQPRFIPLTQYLAEVMFDPFEVVVGYDRGRGFQFYKGGDRFFEYLQVFDKFHGTNFAADSGLVGGGARSLDAPGMLPRQPVPSLELLDRFLNSVAAKQRNPKLVGAKSAAVILEHAPLLAPRGGIHLLGRGDGHQPHTPFELGPGSGANWCQHRHRALGRKPQ